MPCLQSLADCELNPMTKNLLASPTAAMHFKVLAFKMVGGLGLHFKIRATQMF